MNDESPLLLLSRDDLYSLYACGVSDGLARETPRVAPAVAALLATFRARWMDVYMAGLPMDGEAPDWLRELAAGDAGIAH